MPRVTFYDKLVQTVWVIVKKNNCCFLTVDSHVDGFFETEVALIIRNKPNDVLKDTSHKVLTLRLRIF